MIQAERIKRLNDADPRPGRYVLYWMQQSQRAACNHALEYAVRRADELGVHVLDCFGITQRFPGANVRHYRFMLEGLCETGRALRTRGIRLVVRANPPVRTALDLAKRACVLVADRGYLRVQRQWRRRVAAAAPCPVVQVESDVVVPVETASTKEEYAARTIRPKIHARLERFLRPLEEADPRRDSLAMRPGGLKLDSPDAVLARLKIGRGAAPVEAFHGGTGRARDLLEQFIRAKLQNYADARNDPARDGQSHMSPYLHFGQISPLEIALRVQGARTADRRNKDAYLEELIVRRELSMNFCRYNRSYDAFGGLPDWAIETLRRHGRDRRAYDYALPDWENARTHDPYWNAAQREMVLTGKMHGYMRMYWGKKILEWTADPREAFRIAARLNNRYELDGRDPNSWTGVAWCFGKHDRPWGRRPVFGTVRYMNENGLRRKFDADAYVRKVDSLAQESDDGAQKRS